MIKINSLMLDLFYNIAKALLYFVRSGVIGPKDGRFRNAGDFGFWWSSSALAYTSNTCIQSISLI